MLKAQNELIPAWPRRVRIYLLNTLIIHDVRGEIRIDRPYY